MRQNRFSEEQIISILQQQERGTRTADVCREQGISQNTFYAWKSKADQALDIVALKDVVSKKW